MNERNPGREPSIRLLAPAVALALALFLAVLGGCREPIELNDLQRMQQAFRELPAEEREPALRRFAVESPDQGHYGWFELGNLYYDRAGAADPGAARALLDSARGFYDRAIAADSAFVEAYVNLGSLWEDLATGAPQEMREARAQAQASYERAIELRPDDEKARCNLGALFYQQRQYDEALAQFNTVLETDPESALAHYNMAILFADSRIYDEALREWELAAKYDKDGDIGERSRRNIQIIKDLLESDIPENVKGGDGGRG